MIQNFLSNEYFYHILIGAALTMKLAISSILVASIFGMMAALMKISENKILRILAYIYSTLIRGFPDLILLMLMYYGGQTLVNIIAPKLGYADYVDINPFLAGITTLGFSMGAYLSETFRGALMSIPRGQKEAGQAFGLSSWQIFLKITFPQMIRFALPGFINNWLVLTKATALISIIGMQDMMSKAKQAGDATGEPFTYFLFVGFIYLIITSVSLGLLKIVERKYSAGVKAVNI